MVESVSNLSRSGLSDWLIQRVSAVFMAGYFFFLLYFVCGHAPLSYDVWHDLFKGITMKIATLVVLLSLIAHAWIGVWTISTDYLKATWLRGIFQLAVIVALFVCLVWGIYLLWSF